MSNTQTCSVEKQDARPTGAVAERQYVPAVDIVETANEVVVVADLPGASAETLDVRFEDGELRVFAPVASRRKADQRYLLEEYGTGDYQRAFRLGDSIDATKIEARLADGVLTLTLPKVDAMKPRRIPVNAS